MNPRTQAGADEEDVAEDYGTTPNKAKGSRKRTESVGSEKEKDLKAALKVPKVVMSLHKKIEMKILN